MLDGLVEQRKFAEFGEKLRASKHLKEATKEFLRKKALANKKSHLSGRWPLRKNSAELSLQRKPSAKALRQRTRP